MPFLLLALVCLLLAAGNKSTSVLLLVVFSVAAAAGTTDLGELAARRVAYPALAWRSADFPKARRNGRPMSALMGQSGGDGRPP